MKPFIHPKRNFTLIQRKDGRTFFKNWVYFRSILRRDNDEKIWILPSLFKNQLKQGNSFPSSFLKKSNQKKELKWSSTLRSNI